MEKSLDPRVNRLPEVDVQKAPEMVTTNQLETYEVFVQSREGRPLEHEGAVHASDEEMAFIFAKEQFSRRATCIGILIVRTDHVIATPMSEGGINVYESITEPASSSSPLEGYEVFHLFRRGKQHQHAGSVEASSPEQAFYEAKLNLDPGNPAKPVLNVWVVRSNDVFSTEEEDVELWKTTPEKTFREALDYKGAEKIKKYKLAKEQGHE